ncbi:hypothetical protein BC834DRAFT_926047 [Gloeopeniophorella convolvens]|nr:hypothetical protein BC834DRAFT_926047 [Gloeopeniophorella convolvens]
MTSPLIVLARGQGIMPDANGRVVCPECHGTITVGNGGINNFRKQHLGSKKCLPTQQNALSLLRHLEDAISRLPKSIAEATHEDPTAGFDIAPPVDLDPEAAWEVLDGSLSPLFGYGATAEAIAALVRRGPMGMSAVCTYTRCFILEYGINGALVEGKISRMIEGVKLACVPLLCGYGDHALMNTPAAKLAVMRSKLCTGLVLTFPDGCSPYSTYPFGLHDAQNLPWDLEIRNSIMTLRARMCTGQGVVSSRCSACNSLQDSTALKGIIYRIENGVPVNSRYAYHGIAGLMEIARHKTDLIDEYRLARLNAARKLVGLEGAIDVQKQILLAVSSKRIARVDRVLHIGFRRGMGLHALLDLVKRAAEGTYHPKSFDEQEEVQMTLIFRLGGGRVAEIVRKIFGMPALSTIRKRLTGSVLQPSPSMPTRAEVEKNIENVFEGIQDVVADASRAGMSHAVLMWDEIAVERRPRWDSKTNKVLGICRDCGKSTSLDFNRMEDLDVLTVHLASEATVGAIGLLSAESRLYSARPILLSGSCKRETAEEHAALLQTTIDSANSQSSLTRARIVSLASDGEARRGKALVQLTFKALLSPSSPIHALLSPLRLMDFHVGDDDITPDKDYKHVAFKRVRNALLREKGISVLGTWLTPSIIRRHLREAGHKPVHIQSIFNPTDKQDVELAFRLLSDIWSLPKSFPAQNAILAQTEDALRVFGAMCYNLVLPYICIDLTLSEQLTHLSSAAHLALALFSYNNTKSHFLPTTLFIDIMLMIKNVFFCVAKAKVDLPEQPFYLILLGTDRLETLFGILRTMVGNDTNLDVLQLGLRVTGATDVANILAKHPEWDKAPRRLHLPTLTKDAQPANLIPKDVTLATCWKLGRHAMEDKFPAVKDQLHIVDSIEGASILAPFGTLLVRLPTNSGPESDEEDAAAGSSMSGDGLRELEDAADEIDWNHSHITPPAFSNKARALAQRFKYDKNASSTDRLRRVQQESRYGPVYTAGDGEDAFAGVDGPRVMVTDPIATLVRCDGHLFLCIGEINSIRFHSRPQDEVPVALLHETAVQVSYQALSLLPTSTEDNVSSKHDWRSSHLLPITLTAPGILIQPINPKLVSNSLRPPYFLFDSSTLVTLASSLHDRVSEAHRRSVPSVKGDERFPYRESSVDFTSMSGQRVLEHIGSHILHDPAVDRNIEPCGLCLRSYGVCQIYLRKNKGRHGNPKIDKDRSSCPSTVKFSYATAAKSSSSSPCSNVPLACPVCPSNSPAVWRYNLRAHFLRLHPSIPLQSYSHLWTLADSETTEMAPSRKNRLRQSDRSRKKKANNARLTISDAHSSRAAAGLIAGSESSESEEEGDAGSEDDAAGISALDDDVGPPGVEVSVVSAQERGEGMPANMGELAREDNPSEPDALALLPSHPEQGALSVAGSSAPGEPVDQPGASDVVANAASTVLPLVDAPPTRIIECTSPGCQTRWYHLECAQLEQFEKGWVCTPCGDEKARKTKRR